MSIENLSEKIEEAEKRRRQRYPLLDIVDDREQIREISERTIKYMKEIYPDMEGFDESLWELIARVVIEFNKSTIAYLQGEVDKDTGAVSLQIGDFMTIELEHTQIDDAEKGGTLNPNIIMGPELIYYNDEPEKNTLSKEVPSVDLSSGLETICMNVTSDLEKKYGVKNTNWANIIKITLSFYRIARDYLIEHKKDSFYGMYISLTPIIGFGIEAYTLNPDEEITEEGDRSDENTGYNIQFAPEAQFKMASKNDGKTEDR